MWTFLIRRLVQMAVVLVVLSFVLVALLRAMPGDPIDELRADPRIKQKDIDRLKKEFGLDDPLEIFYAKQMRRYFINGDLGHSRDNLPVMDKIGPAIINTLKLTMCALTISLLVAIPIGVYSANRQYSWFDYSVNFLAFVGVSFPSFFLAYLLIWTFSTNLGWLPSGQMHSGRPDPGIAEQLRHLLLPTLSLATLTIGSWTRYMRNSILEVVQLDFVRTAVAKGASTDDVLWKHVFRNALIPMITIFALSMPALFSGALITETVFAWPGMGRELYESVRKHDYNVAVVAFMFLAFLTLLFNTLADVAYAAVDPRIRLS